MIDADEIDVLALNEDLTSSPHGFREWLGARALAAPLSGD